MSKLGIFYAKIDCPLCHGTAEYGEPMFDSSYLPIGTQLHNCDCAFMGIDGNDALGAFDDGNYEIHPHPDVNDDTELWIEAFNRFIKPNLGDKAARIPHDAFIAGAEWQKARK